MKNMNISPILLSLSEEVADALAENRPIVGLESNVITHGLHYPHNVETALAVEASVRRGGAIPATIFIEDGAIRIGSDIDTIERFATMKNVPKVSSRDLPIVLANGGPGATSVASSLICAELAGIQVFSSAGIGGVHRGAERSMDISPDLIQFTRSRVAVVCAGAKNILDLQLTMEFLETHCVPLISYRSDDFPAFFCESSGLRSPHRLDSVEAIARVFLAHCASGAPGGIVVTTPPRPEDALPRAEVEAIITDALAHASASNVIGSGLTKSLMNAINTATGGRSAKANAAVLVSTAYLAGEISAALSKIPVTQ